MPLANKINTIVNILAHSCPTVLSEMPATLPLPTHPDYRINCRSSIQASNGGALIPYLSYEELLLPVKDAKQTIWILNPL